MTFTGWRVGGVQVLVPVGGLLVLSDNEAALVGLDEWSLLPGETMLALAEEGREVAEKVWKIAPKRTKLHH